VTKKAVLSQVQVEGGARVTKRTFLARENK
jgi:hypothetical protein